MVVGKSGWHYLKPRGEDAGWRNATISRAQQQCRALWKAGETAPACGDWRRAVLF